MCSRFFIINMVVEYKNFLWACCEGTLIGLIKTLNIKLSIFKGEFFNLEWFFNKKLDDYFTLLC